MFIWKFLLYHCRNLKSRIVAALRIVFEPTNWDSPHGQIIIDDRDAIATPAEMNLIVFKELHR